MRPLQAQLLFLLSSLIALAYAQTTLIVPHTDGFDDVPALTALLSNTSNGSAGCTSGISIVFSADTTYNVWSPLVFPELNDIEVRIEGNLTYPENITLVQEYVGASNYMGAWITFTGGKNVTLSGSQDPTQGWMNGNGQLWWDIAQQTNRPYGWLFGNITGGVIKNLKVYKPIAWNFITTGSTDLFVYNNTILAGSSNASAYPFNTDGFVAQGNNQVYESNYVVNGDDCIRIADQSMNITWRNGYCEGSHGLSVGSLGADGADSMVMNVLFENSIMNHTLYAARFKSWTGGNGLATNITWRNVLFNDVMFPIYVTQNYWDQSLGPKPNASNINETHISDLLFENFAGSVNDIPGYQDGSCVSDPCWYYVANATGKEVVIFDLYPGSATNIVAQNIFGTTVTGAPVAAMCNTSTISTDVGFVCQDGPYIPTSLGW